MSQICEKCGKGPRSACNVSHSNRHTKRRLIPNLAKKNVLDPKTGKVQKMKICMKCYKTILKEPRVKAKAA